MRGSALCAERNVLPWAPTLPKIDPMPGQGRRQKSYSTGGLCCRSQSQPGALVSAITTGKHITHTHGQMQPRLVVSDGLSPAVIAGGIPEGQHKANKGDAPQAQLLHLRDLPKPCKV